MKARRETPARLQKNLAAGLGTIPVDEPITAPPPPTTEPPFAELTVEVITMRATQTSLLLQEILDQQTPHPYAQWGINE